MLTVMHADHLETQNTLFETQENILQKIATCFHYSHCHILGKVSGIFRFNKSHSFHSLFFRIDSSLECNNWYFNWISILLRCVGYGNNKHHSRSTSLADDITNNVLCSWNNNNDRMETWSSGIS